MVKEKITLEQKKYIAICVILITLAVILMPNLNAGAILDQSYNIALSCDGLDCTSLNITLLFPNSTAYVTNASMTNHITHATYSFTPSVYGDYQYFIFDGTNYGTGSVFANLAGDELNTGEAIIYFIFILGAGLVLFIFVFLALKIDGDDGFDADGSIISVNNMKLVKIAFWIMAYISAFWLMGLLRAITANFTPLINLTRIFAFMYAIMLGLLWPIIIVGGFLLLARWLRNLTIAKKVRRTLGYGEKRYQVS